LIRVFNIKIEGDNKIALNTSENKIDKNEKKIKNDKI
jgi:hypothetical protein